MLVTADDYYDTYPSTAYSFDDIEAALSRAQTRIEGYVDRSLEHQEYTESHHYVGAGPLVLVSWPVSALTSISKDGNSIDPTNVTLDQSNGTLYHNNLLTWAKEVEVVYSAGYAVCPDDIKLVIFDVANAHLDGSLSIMGPTGSRIAKKETVYGVSAVEYGDSVSTSAVGFFPELGPYTKILDKYKRPPAIPRF